MKMTRKNKIGKFIYIIIFFLLKFMKKINGKFYTKNYRKLLASYGMNICKDDFYIDPSTYFDNYDYSKITIKKGVTISREVLFLCHDYSVNYGLSLLDINRKKNAYLLKDIIIEENCFIGARVIILPGTHIEKNCIIGAGAVLKGFYPENSVVAGNPAKVIGSVEKYGKKHLDLKDYIEV